MSFSLCHEQARQYKSNPGMITSYNYMIEKLETGIEGAKFSEDGKWYTSYDKDIIKSRIKSLKDIVDNLKARG